MPGLAFREILHGNFYLLASPTDERAADVTLHVELPMLSHVVTSRTANLVADIHLERFADAAKAHGKVVLVPDERRATYELSFTANDGAPCHFRGHKELWLLRLADALTLLQGSLYDAASREIGRVTLRFDARSNLGSLLRSLRLRW